MKKFIPILLIAFVFASFSSQVNAQLKEKGVLNISITGLTTDDPNMNAMLGLIKDTKTVFYFTPEQTRVSVQAGGGMVNSNVFHDNKTGKSLMLMDVMGKKIAVEMNTDEAVAKAEKPETTVKFEVFEDETLTIVGMECVKVKVTDTNNPKMKMTLYCTKQISGKPSFLKELDTAGIPGFPLKYNIKMEGMDITYEATSYSPDVDPSVFLKSTDGYEIMDAKKFQQSMGGMGGMGF
jgi:hypothetical protein